MIDCELNYWNNYYSNTKSIAEPSSFAKFVCSRYEQNRSLLDIGCGNGRDSFYFASQGWSVTGVDASEAAIQRCREQNLNLGLGCVFSVVDVEVEGTLAAALARFDDPQRNILYARFFLHAIPSSVEDTVMAAAAEFVGRGGQFCAEFRTEEDESLPKVEGAHYRRYIKLDAFQQSCALLGMKVEFLQHGRGLAPYKFEDPFVARIILSKGESCA